MRILLLTAIILAGCGKDKMKRPHEVSNVEFAKNKLHGVWESVMIKTRGGKEPPASVRLTFTTYNNTKLIWMKMKAESKSGKSIENTIRIYLEEKNGDHYIVPSVKRELDRLSEKEHFFKYDPDHIKEVKGLEWKYILGDDKLTIQMDGATMFLRRVK